MHDADRISENERRRKSSGSPGLDRQVAELAEQVRRLGEHVGTRAARPETPANPPTAADPAAAQLIATAERVAEQIRESARREADRIAARGSPELTVALLATVKHQHQTLAVLAAETERIQQGADILRTQIRQLEADIQRTFELLGAIPRPVPTSAALSAPDSSSGTFPRPRG